MNSLATDRVEPGQHNTVLWEVRIIAGGPADGPHGELLVRAFTNMLTRLQNYMTFCERCRLGDERITTVHVCLGQVRFEADAMGLTVIGRDVKGGG